MLRAKGHDFNMRSRNELPGKSDIYLADTIGELGLFYALCPITFVGGSLVPHGGQNPIEPIMHGSLVISGPKVHNFAEAYEELRAAGGCVKIESAEELVAAGET